MPDIGRDIARLNDEVFVTRHSLSTTPRHTIETLKIQAKQNPSGKCRLLLHRNREDLLHQMLIVHNSIGYIRPHINPGKSKSWHILEGLMDCVLFADDGGITDHWHMGDYSSGKTFITRLSHSQYHTLIPLTEPVVYIETIMGPFLETPYAPWAPDSSDLMQCHEYFQLLCKQIGIVHPATSLMIK